MVKIWKKVALKSNLFLNNKVNNCLNQDFRKINKITKIVIKKKSC